VGGVVTALNTQSKSRTRVNVYLDGAFEFGLAKKLAYGLRIGQELSDEEIETLRRRDQEDGAFQRAMRLISRRPRSEYELRTNFNRHKVPDEVQDEVLFRLREADLVDDGKFAAFWVENRQHFRPRAARALRRELKLKGVLSETIDTVLEDFDEEEAAYLAAMKGSRRWRTSTWKIFRQRLGAYLARRGFNYSTISSVLPRVWRETTGVENESEVTK
jgi:regulatory protein